MKKRLTNIAISGHVVSPCTSTKQPTKYKEPENLNSRDRRAQQRRLLKLKR